MNILLTNDDGYQSPNLKLLIDYFFSKGHNVFAIAPDGQRSGFSQKITIFEHITERQISENVTAISGTPADCVIYGLQGLSPFKPDLIISGMNNGFNAGRDMMYSGTAAAARQGAMLNIPSMAVSYNSWTFDIFTETVTGFFDKYFDRMFQLAKDTDYFVNINFPHASPEKVTAVKSTFISEKMEYKDELVTFNSPNGVIYHWIKGEPANQSQLEPGSDAYELFFNNCITVSLVKVYPDCKKFDI